MLSKRQQRQKHTPGLTVLLKENGWVKTFCLYCCSSCSSLQPVSCSHISRSELGSSKVFRAVETCVVTKARLPVWRKGASVNREAFVAPIFVFSPRQGCLATLWVSFPRWETWDNESVVQLIKSQWHLLGALLASSEGWKSLDRALLLP